MPAANRQLIQVVAQLQPERCGVSDFAILLARELESKFGIGSAFAVINSTAPCDVSFPRVYRTQAELLDACNVLSCGEPGTLLVHLSGYGFSRDGAPRELADALSQVRKSGKFKIAVCFHELYATGMPWRSAFWYSARQRRAVRRIAKDCDVIVTTREENAKWLERAVEPSGGGPVHLLPVFSNVGEPQELTPMELREPVMVVLGRGNSRKRAYRRLSQIAGTVGQLGIREIIDIGPEFEPPSQVLGIPIRRMGVLDARMVSEILSHSRFGFVPHPPSSLAKSGIFEGLCAHGTVPLLGVPFRGVIDGLQDGVHLISPRSTKSALAGRLESCSSAAWRWYSGHGLRIHAATYARLLFDRTAS
jgi:hypothetical protein